MLSRRRSRILCLFVWLSIVRYSGFRYKICKIFFLSYLPPSISLPYLVSIIEIVRTIIFAHILCAYSLWLLNKAIQA